jgi:hypothetical protein
MELATGFTFQPLDNDEGTPPPVTLPAGLGPLAGLAGSWAGRGFNAIWRPHRDASDHFLELNVTSDQIDLQVINGQIPNRGLVTAQIFMHGLTYLQQISDANVTVSGVPAGLHIEPGVWINIPPTADPKEPGTIARLASIPHGTTIVAQGTATTVAGPPTIPGTSIKPFTIGQPLSLFDFPEETLAAPSSFRTAGAGLTGVTQQMVSNPNSVLQAAIAGQHITQTTTLHVNTNDAPILGGGTANTAFLKGGGGGPNAVSASVNATFWLETIEGNPVVHQLQYAQTVLLNFNGLSWPHITVATLRQ